MSSAHSSVLQHVLAATGVGATGASVVRWLPPAVGVVAGLCAILFYVFQIWESHTVRARVRLHRRKWVVRRTLEREVAARALAAKQVAEATALLAAQTAERVSLIASQTAERLTVIGAADAPPSRPPDSP